MPRTAINTAISLIRDGWDDGDKWGSAINALFDVANVMDAADIDVPEELEFHRSYLDIRSLADMANEERDDYAESTYGEFVLASEYLAGNITENDMRLAALTLNRYLALCRAAGLDY